MKIRNTTPTPAPAPPTPATANRFPLSLLAVEFGESVDQLATRLGDRVFIDHVGLRCVREDVVRELVREREAARDKAIKQARERAEEEARQAEQLARQAEQQRREREALFRWRASVPPSGDAFSDLYALNGR